MSPFIKLTDFVPTRLGVEEYRYCVEVPLGDIEGLIAQFNKNPDLRVEGVMQTSEEVKTWEESCQCSWHRERKR